MLASPVHAQAAKEVELQEKVRKLEQELADARSQLKRLRGKDAPGVVDMLEEDFQKLLKKDRQATFMLQAAQQFLDPTDNNRWNNDANSTTLIRQHRSQAAIPLLLKYLIVRPEADRGSGGVNGYLETLTVLTGEDVKRLYAKAGSAEEFVKQWWFAGKDRITVDFEVMQREQLERVVATLFMVDQRARFRSRRELPHWYPNEIHAAMLPILLERCGVDGAGKNKASGQALDQDVISALAQLRMNGEAPYLDKLAKDPKQSASARLICMLANHAAGEDLATEALLDLHMKEKNLEIREAALSLLPESTAPPSSAPRLLAALDDPNARIRSAAISAMTAIPVPAALPKLAQMLERTAAGAPANDWRNVLSAVTRIGSTEATQVMAAQLETCVKNKNWANSIYYVLSEFEKLTGQQWNEAGAHDNAFYIAKANQALEWWRGQNKKDKKP
jgi:hypothetical protein